MGKCLKLQISISEGKNLSNTSDEQGEQGGNGK